MKHEIFIFYFCSIIDPQMGHLEPLLLIQGVEALDTGMEKVEVITIDPLGIITQAIVTQLRDHLMVTSMAVVEEVVAAATDRKEAEIEDQDRGIEEVE